MMRYLNHSGYMFMAPRRRRIFKKKYNTHWQINAAAHSVENRVRNVSRWFCYGSLAHCAQRYFVTRIQKFIYARVWIWEITSLNRIKISNYLLIHINVVRVQVSWWTIFHRSNFTNLSESMFGSIRGNLGKPISIIWLVITRACSFYAYKRHFHRPLILYTYTKQLHQLALCLIVYYMLCYK